LRRPVPSPPNGAGATRPATAPADSGETPAVVAFPPLEGGVGRAVERAAVRQVDAGVELGPDDGRAIGRRDRIEADHADAAFFDVAAEPLVAGFHILAGETAVGLAGGGEIERDRVVEQAAERERAEHAVRRGRAGVEREQVEHVAGAAFDDLPGRKPPREDAGGRGEDGGEQDEAAHRSFQCSVFSAHKESRKSSSSC